MYVLCAARASYNVHRRPGHKLLVLRAPEIEPHGPAMSERATISHLTLRTLASMITIASCITSRRRRASPFLHGEDWACTQLGPNVWQYSRLGAQMNVIASYRHAPGRPRVHLAPDYHGRHPRVVRYYERVTIQPRSRGLCPSDRKP